MYGQLPPPGSMSMLYAPCICFTPARKAVLPQRHRRWSPAAAENDKDLLTAIEDQEKGKQEQRQAQKGFGAPQKPRKKAQGSQARPFQVEYPQAQAAQTPGQQLEANVVRLLAFIFVVFFVEGIFLAVAGFLPEAADNFATNYVYPAFSPTLGVFLAISIVYGLVKTRQGKE